MPGPEARPPGGPGRGTRPVPRLATRPVDSPGRLITPDGLSAIAPARPGTAGVRAPCRPGTTGGATDAEARAAPTAPVPIPARPAPGGCPRAGPGGVPAARAGAAAGGFDGAVPAARLGAAVALRVGDARTNPSGVARAE